MTTPPRDSRSVAIGRRAAFGRARRRGYTLMELCVVMGIIVLLAALVVPSYQGMMAGARVDAAGDMILARMADARSMAMEQGKAFRFGYQSGTGHFMIAADNSPLWQGGGAQNGTIDTKDELAGQLPQDVMFAKEMSALSNSGGPSAGGGWQVGAIFLADGTGHGGMNSDGTTIDDMTFYYGMSGRAPQGVRLRGLTGTVRLFDPASPEAHHP